EEHYIGEVSEKQREIYISELADVLTKNGKKPHIIENGATTIHGSVGYIHLPLELAALGSEYSITDLFVPGGIRKYAEVTKHQHKRALALTSRKLVRLVF
ncbi:hypothetical protein NE556_23600, partial [[Clostridium] symbiosum]|nr:hypothetical protein [[Clostridium] symbiosum]